LASYCIGDLHGREDLFFQLIEKIEFDPQKDKLYILGDVIDRNYGGVKIIQYLKSHREACTLIKGNHEGHFLHMKKAYDVFMLNPRIKRTMKAVSEVYSEDLYRQIETGFVDEVRGNGIAAIEKEEIRAWIEKGTAATREKLLLSMAEFLESIECNEDVYKSAKYIWGHFNSQFCTKNFALELFEQSAEEYQSIVEYLEEAPYRVSLKINEKNIVLLHAVNTVNEKLYNSNMFPHAKTNDIIYVFGHQPVSKMYRGISSPCGCCGFSFDFRQVFAYCDEKNNRYYNLDLGSDPIVALCLDNMNEYYVGKPSQRANASKWKVPTDKIGRNTEENIFPVEKAGFLEETTRKVIPFESGEKKKNRAYVTKNEGCYEFLIGTQYGKKRILYTRIDLLDRNYAFSIEGWYHGQPIEEVVQKVKEDFTSRSEAGELEDVYQILYGTELKEN